jgi:hypothetical protein
MIRRKAGYGSRNHQKYMIGATRIDQWFADPPGFLKALVETDWIRPGDWANSRFKALTDFETGPMFRVFTEEELALWEAYANSLTAPKPAPAPPEPLPAQAMARLISELRPVQRGIAGHQINMLADIDGTVHTLTWWFEQPTGRFMAALASPVNDIIVPGEPENSRFITELIAPTGPMGSVFSGPATPPAAGARRDVVYRWVEAGCPMIATHPETLRLNTPATKRALHATGRIYGMGTVH